MNKLEAYFPSPLLKKALKICQAAQAAGGRAVLVGGCVRDALLGRASQDLDIEVFKLPPEALHSLLRKNFSVDLVGKSFAVFKLKGWAIDVSTPRRETKMGEGHKGFFVASDPSLGFAEAASRRDFTLNALMYDPLNGELIDTCGGHKDLQSGVLRHVSGQFGEDPLRPLRAMQMVARFGFTVASETKAICQNLSQTELSKERIFDEWKKMLLKGHKISAGLEFLREIGWLRFYPELEALVLCPQDLRWHPEGSVWEHTKLCMDAFANLRGQTQISSEAEVVLESGEVLSAETVELILGLAVLTHDFGKAATTSFEGDAIKSPAHETVGLPLASSFVQRLTSQTNLLPHLLPLVQCHMQPYALFKEQSKPAAIRRLALKAHRLDWLERVCLADYIGCSRPNAFSAPHLVWLKTEAANLSLHNQAPKPLILGRHLMALQIPPSPAYKKS